VKSTPLLLVIGVFLFAIPHGFADETPNAFRAVSLAISSGENRVSVEYDLRCDADRPGYGAIRGEAILPEGITRFDLYGGHHETDFLLPPSDSSAVEIRFFESSTCFASNVVLKANSVEYGNDIQSLVRRYSPYFVVRKNQISDRDTDVPLALTYNIFRPDSNRRIIQYSLYYTDEDSKKTQASEEAQMTRYGRRLDIQWAYRVEIDSNGEKLTDRFQGGILRTGLGHANLKFRGQYVAGTDHPILYDIADHNAYSDQPCFGLKKPIGYFFSDANENPDPTAREDELFKNPWLFQASDRELAQEGKLPFASDEYLYVSVVGAILKGAVVPKLETSDGDVYFGASGQGSLDRLGEDTWGKKSYSAIAIGREKLTSLLEIPGEMLRVTFRSKGMFGAKIRFERLKFFVLHRAGDTYRVDDISDRFECFYPKSGRPSCTSRLPSTKTELASASSPGV
jgi:hypothetical protein